MDIPIFQVDAFTDTPFSGNPAAVCPLDAWLPDDRLQAIAMENNLSETAFFVPRTDGSFDLRWFTPAAEIDLCGHATLASGHVLVRHLGFSGDRIAFHSRSGPLFVNVLADKLALDFPSRPGRPIHPPAALTDGLSMEPVETCQARDFLAVLASVDAVLACKPDFDRLAELPCTGIIITAPGTDCDFVSRFFAPAVGVPEDPVTGSAHCTLTPYWANRLGKTELTARQLSRRGGTLWCTLAGDRVHIAGQAVTVLTGKLHLP